MIYVLIAFLSLVQPCHTEDSANCYWNAKAMGNGQGRSFIDVMGYTL